MKENNRACRAAIEADSADHTCANNNQRLPLDDNAKRKLCKQLFTDISITYCEETGRVMQQSYGECGRTFPSINQLHKIMAKNIIITERMEESLWGFRYCEVNGTKWFNRCVFPKHGRLKKGDVFNVYRREYETGSDGNIARWICDSKFGCEYDGRSIVSSLETFDKELDEYYTTGAGRYSSRKPLA